MNNVGNLFEQQAQAMRSIRQPSLADIERSLNDAHSALIDAHISNADIVECKRIIGLTMDRVFAIREEL